LVSHRRNRLSEPITWKQRMEAAPADTPVRSTGN
jgi:hypothetical protein